MNDRKAIKIILRLKCYATYYSEFSLERAIGHPKLKKYHIAFRMLKNN